MDLIPVALPVTFLTAAALAVLVGQFSVLGSRVVAVVASGTAAVLAIVGLLSALDGGPLRHELGGWPPPIGIEYVLDPLSGFMASIIAVMGFLVIIYPTRAGFDTVDTAKVPLYPLVLLLLGGLMGVTMSADLFHLFVFLEIYAIATYALVALGGPRATFASLRYLIFGTIGSGLYLLGVGFIYFMTGSLNMGDVAERLGPVLDNETVVAGLVLIVIGLAVKMALFPLHVWLPEAHSYAPPGVAALLAAVQVKVAAYALIRILYEVFGFEFVTVDVPVTDLLVWFGAAGILFGSAMAIAQRDFKRMLAYSTVAQLGYIGVGIGLATPLALVGALLHVLNHALMKGCLFLIAGGLYAQTGIRDISKMAGMAKRMPITAAAFTVAALSMIGVPPTAGFFSKWYLLLGSLDGGRILVAAVIGASSLLTLWYFLRVFQTIYSDPPEVDPAMASAREPGLAVLGPVLVLAGALLVAGLGNAVLVSEVLEPATDGLVAAVDD
ncbi:MAG: monovalent cation/H+ antiporter subunit D family protein [Acidimicrobiales bacterium]